LAITRFFAEKGDKIGFDALLGIPFWAGALALAAILVVVLVGLERKTPWRRELGDSLDGLKRSQARG
jgi:hypothetical protein